MQRDEYARAHAIYRTQLAKGSHTICGCQADTQNAKNAKAKTINVTRRALGRVGRLERLAAEAASMATTNANFDAAASLPRW